MLKIVSWNVNGIRALLRKEVDLRDLGADILCLQEVKARQEQVTGLQEMGFVYWHSAEKAGYSGTAVFTRKEPQEVICGIPGFDETEGRVLTLRFPKAYVVNAYVPNSKRGLLRLEYRTKIWDIAFRNYLKELAQDKTVIFCGDLNVAHQEIDIANPKGNRRNAGFTDEERESFSDLLNAGFVDCFRHFNKEPGQYTWWSQRPGVRERNIGWRIDYFGISREGIKSVRKAEIHSDIMGSDHCPLSLVVDKKIIF